MEKRNIIVIGASTGGFEALKQVVAGFPKQLEAAVFIVWHISPETSGILPYVLNKLDTLPAANAMDREKIKMGRIYVAPPDHHLMIENNHVRVTKGPKENRFRPAVDPLFRSAAYAYGSRVIGVILSGALDDGTAGLWTIRERGGLTMVQDPADAAVPAMPANALKEVYIDFMLPAPEIGDMLAKLSGEQAPEFKYTDKVENKKTEMELDMALQQQQFGQDIFALGQLTPFTCPECHGVLTAIKDGNRMRYRCHTGHAFSADSLMAAITAKTENSLWHAVRELRETSMLLNHVGDHFAENNQPHEAAVYFQKAKDTLHRSEQIRNIILEQEQFSVDALDRNMQNAGLKKQAG